MSYINSKTKACLMALVFTGASMASTTEAHAYIRFCGLVTVTGSGASDREVSGILRKYDDTVRPLFDCKKMQTDLKNSGLQWNSEVTDEWVVRTHKRLMLDNYNGATICEPWNLMRQDENYYISWKASRDGYSPSSCWTVRPQ